MTIIPTLKLVIKRKELSIPHSFPVGTTLQDNPAYEGKLFFIEEWHLINIIKHPIITYLTKNWQMFPFTLQLIGGMGGDVEDK